MSGEPDNEDEDDFFLYFEKFFKLKVLQENAQSSKPIYNFSSN